MQPAGHLKKKKKTQPVRIFVLYVLPTALFLGIYFFATRHPDMAAVAWSYTWKLAGIILLQFIISLFTEYR